MTDVHNFNYFLGQHNLRYFIFFCGPPKKPVNKPNNFDDMIIEFWYSRLFKINYLTGFIHFWKPNVWSLTFDHLAVVRGQRWTDTDSTSSGACISVCKAKVCKEKSIHLVFFYI